MTQKDRLATVFLRLPDDVKQKLKMLAVSRHTTMATIIRDLIEQELSMAEYRGA